MSDANDERVINNVSPAMKNFLLSTVEAHKPFHERVKEISSRDVSNLKSIVEIQRDTINKQSVEIAMLLQEIEPV